MKGNWIFRLKPEATRLRASRFGAAGWMLKWLPALAGRKRPALVLCAVAIGLLAWWLRAGPLPAGLLDAAAVQSTTVVDRHGTPLYEAVAGGGVRSLRLEPATIPELVAAATVAAEDRRFWRHPGVDAIAIGRALQRNISERQIVEGGSTITQQVAKLLLNRQSPERRRGWRTKVSEAILALRLEHRLQKREILALYLNLAAYGNQTAGFERASQTYFGVESRMLTAAQAAFLAGLPQRPTTFNPYRNQAAATSRQRYVLAQMTAAGFLTAAQVDEARGERLVFARVRRPFLAPHFVEMVLGNIRPAGRPRPSRIETTLDARLQEDISGIIRTQRASLVRHGAANVAVVVLDNERGEWLAWEGSGDYFDVEHGGAINGPLMLRQPGSALKPLTYALAFEKGFTPASVLPDVPMHFPTAEPGVVYSPRNYDGRYRGPLLARAALAGSENVPAVSLASELGVPDLLRFLNRAGFSTFDKTAAHYGLGLTLGNAEVRLDELVTAYAALARGGEWQRSTYLRGVSGERRTLVTPRTAFWLADILSDAEARAYIFGRGGSLELPFPVAVKTGTSQAYHDNWTVGFTRRVTVGVWVGNFDRRPLRNSSGVTGAAPIFQAVMLAAHRRLELPGDRLLDPDPSLAARPICALSGELANSWCPVRRSEWLPVSSEPVPCGWHHLADEGPLVVWPAPFREWARQNDPSLGVMRTSVRSAPGTVRRVQASRAAAALQLVNPPPGATYLIDPTLRRDFQTLSLRVVAPVPTTIEWTVNGAAVGRSSSEAAVEWPLRPGQHRIAARDTAGHVVESVVTVR
jgi:penicillin-binding protein 1C